MSTNPDVIITTELEQAGCVSYWRVADGGIKLEVLAARWAEQGLSNELLPSAPDDTTALGRAVAEQAGRRTLVRPLARRGAWAIVEETVADGGELEYRTLVKVEFVNGNAQITGMAGALKEYKTLTQVITDAYARHQGTLASTDVTSWLVGLVRKHAKAVSLRDTGGVYFVPRGEVGFWSRVKAAVEATAGYYIFTIPAMKNAEAVAAITEAIAREATDILTAIEAELTKTGDEALGKRALDTRTATADALIAKLNTYEELIGTQLTVRNQVMELNALLAARALAETT